MGWFGRTLGCKPPRGEQMRMTRWSPAGFPTAPSTAAPQLYYRHPTPAKPRPRGGYKAIYTSAFCHSSIQSSLKGPLCYLARSRAAFGAALCCYCCWSCSAQLRHLPSRCLQGVFVLPSLRRENSHKTRCFSTSQNGPA